MNKIKFSTGLLTIGIVIAMGMSCKKALDLNAVGYVTSDKAITKESDLFDLLSSGYFALADGNYYGGLFQTHNELLADHLDGTALGGNYLSIYSRSVTIFNSSVSDLYAQMNKPVYQANLVLDNLALASAANKNRLEGEAKFMRSIAWFDLVRMYAHPYTAAGAATTPGIPLRLNSQRQKVSRKTVAEVYQQIITDLKQAETLLPSSNGVLANKWSAKALLAKVYFQMNDFANAYLYSNDVISNGGFAFDPEIFNRFSPDGTTESVFYLVHEAGNNANVRFGTIRGNFNSLASDPPALRLTNDFYNKATSNSSDTRVAWYKKKNGFNLLGKYDSSVITLPVIHLTELMLIYAESAAETNQTLPTAVDDLNETIARAYGPASSLLLPSSADAAMIRDVARRERELEMAGEGNRLQELKRRAAKGEAVSIRGAVYNCPGLIFPFPENEVIYSPDIVQNPTGGCN